MKSVSILAVLAVTWLPHVCDDTEQNTVVSGTATLESGERASGVDLELKYLLKSKSSFASDTTNMNGHFILISSEPEVSLNEFVICLNSSQNLLVSGGPWPVTLRDNRTASVEITVTNVVGKRPNRPSDEDVIELVASVLATLELDSSLAEEPKLPAAMVLNIKIELDRFGADNVDKKKELLQRGAQRAAENGTEISERILVAVQSEIIQDYDLPEYRMMDVLETVRFLLNATGPPALDRALVALSFPPEQVLSDAVSQPYFLTSATKMMNDMNMTQVLAGQKGFARIVYTDNDGIVRLTKSLRISKNNQIDFVDFNEWTEQEVVARQFVIAASIADHAIDEAVKAVATHKATSTIIVFELDSSTG